MVHNEYMSVLKDEHQYCGVISRVAQWRIFSMSRDLGPLYPLHKMKVDQHPECQNARPFHYFPVTLIWSDGKMLSNSKTLPDWRECI